MTNLNKNTQGKIDRLTSEIKTAESAFKKYGMHAPISQGHWAIFCKANKELIKMGQKHGFSVEDRRALYL